MALAGLGLGIWLWQTTGYGSTGILVAHVALGLVVVGLGLLQGLALALRPKPKHRLRRGPHARIALAGHAQLQWVLSEHVLLHLAKQAPRPRLMHCMLCKAGCQSKSRMSNTLGLTISSQLALLSGALAAWILKRPDDRARLQAWCMGSTASIGCLKQSMFFLQVGMEPVSPLGGPHRAAGRLRQRNAGLCAGPAAGMVLLRPGHHLGRHLAGGRRQDAGQCSACAAEHRPGRCVELARAANFRRFTPATQ